MGKTIAYLDATGNANASSYWQMDHMDIRTSSRTMEITWIAYRDKPSYLAGKQPVGSKVYRFTGAAFDAAVGPIYNAVKTQGYAACEAVMDVIDPVTGVARNFFQGAVND